MPFRLAAVTAADAHSGCLLNTAQQVLTVYIPASRAAPLNLNAL